MCCGWVPSPHFVRVAPLEQSHDFSLLLQPRCLPKTSDVNTERTLRVGSLLWWVFDIGQWLALQRYLLPDRYAQQCNARARNREMNCHQHWCPTTVRSIRRLDTPTYSTTSVKWPPPSVLSAEVPSIVETPRWGVCPWDGRPPCRQRAGLRPAPTWQTLRGRQECLPHHHRGRGRPTRQQSPAGRAPPRGSSGRSAELGMSEGTPRSLVEP
jgi:hypothetical protein